LFAISFFTGHEMTTTTTNTCVPVAQPEVGEWVPCVTGAGYEICTQFPYQVRRRRGTRIVIEHLNTTGYICLHLNRRKYTKHRVVTLQFVPNPNPAEFTEVDHINRIRTDNHVVNLRWVSRRMNALNKTSHKSVVYTYTNTIPDDVVAIHMYNNHVFKGYSYSRTTDTCYFYNELQYRVLTYSTTTRGAGRRITIQDIDHITRTVYLDKWLRERV